LPTAISTLDVDEEGLRVVLKKPIHELGALSLVVAPAIVELLVDGAQHILKVSAHLLRRELIEEFLELGLHVACLRQGTQWAKI
jgi:hypothetical protein